jgi:hypothetical protein
MARAREKMMPANRAIYWFRPAHKERSARSARIAHGGRRKIKNKAHKARSARSARIAHGVRRKIKTKTDTDTRRARKEGDPNGSREMKNLPSQTRA